MTTLARQLYHLRRLLLLLAVLLLGSPAFGALGSLSLRADPEVVRADGHSTTTITAEVRNSGGSIVPDGTEVHFTTTAGRIDEAAGTQAGRARATFTSDAIAGVAQVSAFSSAGSATISVRMVEDPEAISPATRVLVLDGKYVAYSESRGVMEAIGDARLSWQGQLITAQAIQADLFGNQLRARDGVKVQSHNKKASLSADRIAVDMSGGQATVVNGDARQVIDFPSLTPLTGPHPTAPSPLLWADLNDSDMLWVASRAIAIPGQKVQLRKVAAYLGGQRVLRLPYHEVSLTEGLSSQGQQYFGVGTNGLEVDLPYFLGMSASSSTSLHLRRGNRSGFGWYGTNNGWQLALDRQYGLPGGTQGTFGFDQITSSEWGLHWNHSQHLAPGTQAYALLEYPAHKDLYGNLNLSEQGRWGNLGLNLSGNKLQGHGFGRTIDLSAQTASHPVAGKALQLSLESRFYDSRGGDYVAFDGKRYEIAPSFSRELGLRLTPAMLKIGRGGVSSWVSVKQVWGSQDRSGFGLAGALALNHPIGRIGSFSLNYSYNRFPGVTFYGTEGRQNLSSALRLTPTRRLTLSMFGSLGLDSPSHTLTADAGYSLSRLWRLDLQQTAYRFPTLSEQDLQFGVSRVLGARQLTVYWSTLRHRIMFDLGGGAF